MKKILRNIAFGAMGMVFVGPASATTEPIGAAVKILVPIGIEEEASMDFGTLTLTPNTLRKIAVLAPGGTVTGNYISSDQLATAAKYKITGSPGELVSLSMVTVVEPINGTDELSVGFFTMSSGLGTTLDANDGTATVTVGGALIIPASTKTGTFTGSIRFSANYN